MEPIIQQYIKQVDTQMLPLNEEDAPTVDAVPTQSVRDINVLNKIRVEIKEELKQDNHSFYRAALEDVLKIIDKYKAGE